MQPENLKFYYLPKIAGSGFRIVALPDTLQGQDLRTYLKDKFKYYYPIKELKIDSKGEILNYNDPSYEG